MSGNEICGNSLSGIYISANRCAALDNTVRDNYLYGMYILTHFLDEKYVTEITGNTVSANGGVGVYVQAGDDILLEGNVVTDNRDGSIQVKYQDYYTTIRQNEVPGNTGSSFGGIYLEGSSIVENNVIEYNTSANFAGGVNMVFSDAVLRGNTIRFNSARCAGGVVVAAYNTVIEDNWFEGNTPDDFSCYDLEFTGAVKHADGSPLPGIEVRIQEIRAGGGEWIVMTDENGVFQPEDWVTIDGRVIVTPITPGYVYTPESIGVSAPWETPEFVATPQS